MQEQIILECTICRNRNYSSSKNKKTVTDRLELKKFCKFCRKHTPHKEIK
ncbi:MAG: 50S ribosomal protein L33 [Omnitrophica WOR_2 bacterium SM23_29]|nr:MAG: 50S ribosomal protein L33 [Omnitrophica WOR_2 bacterium SM23_29]